MNLLYFPNMHPELAPWEIPAGVSFLDPGLLLADSGQQFHYLRPGNLPLDQKQARGYLQQVQNLSAQLKSPKELEALNNLEFPHTFSQTSLALADELRANLQQKGAAPKAKQNVAAPELQAQMTLLLAWELEEQYLEMSRLERGLHNKWHSMQNALGLEGEKPDFFPSSEFSADTRQQAETGPWTRLLVCLLSFLQSEDDWLYVDQEHIWQDWLEQGLKCSDLQDDLLQELQVPSGSLDVSGLQRLRARGWELALYSRPVPEKPWLDNYYNVLVACAGS